MVGWESIVVIKLLIFMNMQLRNLLSYIVKDNLSHSELVCHAFNTLAHFTSET